MNSRLLYMDNLKGICILLVVFCHYTLLSGSSVVGNAIMTLASAAVPCFMMITGGLLCRTKSDFDWKKNTRDNGYHLNIYGADIVTQKLEETIKQYNLPNHKEDSNYQHWNESYQIYEELIKSKK